MSVMMKKAICAILIIVLCFFLCGCGREAGKYDEFAYLFIAASVGFIFGQIYERARRK